MSWFKVDDQLFAHPKAREAGLAAIGLWSVCGSYSSAYLTEGWVPKWFVTNWPSGMKLAKKLVACGLWEEAEGGWQFHQWEERNPSKEQVQAERTATRVRQQKWRDAKRDKPVSNGVTNGVTNGAPTRPDPTVVTEVTTNTGSLRSPAAANRGTRLPGGWQPDHDLVEQMRQECPAVDLRSEHRVFADYWSAQPGQKGVKTDWPATWRNWMRKASKDGHGAAAPRRSTTDDRVGSVLAFRTGPDIDRKEINQ